MKRKSLNLCLALLWFAQTLHSQSTTEQIDRVVKHYAAEGLFNGSILVAEKGNVVYKSAAGMANMEWSIPNTPQTKFRIGSVTKQFTAMLIMQLVNEGKIKLHEPITRYLTNYRRDTGDSISIHHLLSHSSGIPNYTRNEQFFKGDSKQTFVLADFIRLYCSGDLQFTPGTKFDYSNSGYFILGAIIEAVTKKSYTEVLQQNILNVVGMNNTGYDFTNKIIPNRASGYEAGLYGYSNAEYLDMGLPYAAGSLYSTVEDLFLWNNALLTQKLLPDSLKKKMFTGYVDDGMDKAGYGWFTRNFSNKDSTQQTEMIWHDGGINGFSSELLRFPRDENFIVILDNTSSAPRALANAITNILYDLPNPPLKPLFAAAIKNKVANGSAAEALTFYNSLSKEEKEKYDYTGAERQLNRWGYQLLNDRKDVAGAIHLFEINVKQFPRSANVYDSYADALMAGGNTVLATENYKKSLALDANNNRARAYVDGMAKKADTIRVMVDGHEMVLYKTGNKVPVVVLEAGGNSDHRSWNSIVPELAKTMTVVTYDRPGYLASQSCAYPRTANRVAAELHEALNKAGIKGPYVVGGWSWGGFFARAFAAKYPLATKGVLLVDPAQGETYLQMADQQPDDFTKSLMLRSGDNQAAEDEFAAMMASMQQADLSDKNYKGKIELLIAGSFKGWTESEKPSKQIWIDELVKWAKLQKNSRYQIVDSGHSIQFEKPAVVIDAIKRLAGE